MNAKDDLSNTQRLEALARRAGAERSLYMGEAIGNALLIAWNGIGSLGGWFHRPKRAAPPARGPGYSR